MSVLAIVLHYNNFDYTKECVEAVLAQTADDLDVVIVDNGSTNGSAAALRAHFGAALRVITLASNRGIPGALNEGLKLSLQENHWASLIVLNDTSLAPDAAARLIGRLHNNESLGAVAPVQVYYENPAVVTTAGGTIDFQRWWVGHRHLNGAAASLQELPDTSPEWLDFTCILIRNDALQRVGLLQEKYRFYWDDVDWGVRCRRCGFALAVQSDAIIRHRIGGTMNAGRSAIVSYYVLRNRLLSRFLLFGRLSGTLLLARELTALLLASIKTDRDRSGYGTRRRALTDFLFRRPYPEM